jgi:tRNA G18 (ribose-2'-O)-methylase SpoU
MYRGASLTIVGRRTFARRAFGRTFYGSYDSNEVRTWSPSATQCISSVQNARVKTARTLAKRRGREKTDLVLLEGHRLCCDALEAALCTAPSNSLHVPLPQTVFIDEAAFLVPEGERLQGLLEQLPHEVVVSTTREVLATVTTTETPQGCAVVLPRPELPWDQNAKLVLVCDNIRDPGNLGTLIRSSGAAGVDGILLIGGCADPWSPKALRSAMGATLRLPIAISLDWETAIASGSGFLQEEKMSFYAADASSALPYYAVDWTNRSAIIVGSEAAGLSTVVRRSVDEGKIKLVSIPLAPGRSQVESLNAAVAGSVILCEARRQLACQST